MHGTGVWSMCSTSTIDVVPPAPATDTLCYDPTCNTTRSLLRIGPSGPRRAAGKRSCGQAAHVGPRVHDATACRARGRCQASPEPCI
eukprot:scaffold7946_cov403-Prasinococcus_capsulatus_cf.AAC.6